MFSPLGQNYKIGEIRSSRKIFNRGNIRSGTYFEKAASISYLLEVVEFWDEPVFQDKHITSVFWNWIPLQIIFLKDEIRHILWPEHLLKY